MIKKILLCLGVIMTLNANDNYLVLRNLDMIGGNSLVQYDVKKKEEKLIIDYPSLKNGEDNYIPYEIFNINGKLFVNARKQNTIHEVIAQLDKNLQVTNMKDDMVLLARLKKRELLLVRTYTYKPNKTNPEAVLWSLYLMDLNFNKVKFISHHPSQLNYLVISDDQFIYTEDVRNQPVKFWLYDIPAAKKKRLKELEDTCEYSMELYRSKTKQLVCRTSNGYILTDIDGKNQEKIKINSGDILYYDKKNDLLIYSDYRFSFLRFTSVFNLYSYDFKTKRNTTLEENYLVQSIDSMAGM